MEISILDKEYINSELIEVLEDSFKQKRIKYLDSIFA